MTFMNYYSLFVGFIHIFLENRMNNHIFKRFSFLVRKFLHCKKPVFTAFSLFIASNMCLIFNSLPATTHELSGKNNTPRSTRNGAFFILLCTLPKGL